MLNFCLLLAGVAASDCSQPARERNALIDEAESEQLTLRRTEFIGLTYTRDHVVRDRMTPIINEGDIFTRNKLVRSLRSMSPQTDDLSVAACERNNSARPTGTGLWISRFAFDSAPDEVHSDARNDLHFGSRLGYIKAHDPKANRKNCSTSIKDHCYQAR